MIDTERKRKFTGIGLIVVGALFLMVSNDIWLGWANVWPLFPILGGMLFLRVYARNKSPEMLFVGSTTALMGVFLLFFSMEIFSWSRMDVLWPVIPTIAGVGLLAVAAAMRHSAAYMIMGVVIVLFAFLGFLHEGGVINERVVAPFIRLWPLVLVVAGVVLLRSRPAEPAADADVKAVREVIDADEKPESAPVDASKDKSAEKPDAEPAPAADEKSS
jgi:hypothetical protein